MVSSFSIEPFDKAVFISINCLSFALRTDWFEFVSGAVLASENVPLWLSLNSTTVADAVNVLLVMIPKKHLCVVFIR